MCLCVCVFVCLFVGLCVCLFVCLFVCLYVCLFVCLCVCVFRDTKSAFFQHYSVITILKKHLMASVGFATMQVGQP